MKSITVKEDNIYSFWISLHELDAEYQVDQYDQVYKLSVYLKRELPGGLTDSMRRSIRKGGMIQLNYNKIKTVRNTLAASRLSNEVDIGKASEA